MAALNNTTIMLSAISLLLGIMVIDCAYDLPAFEALEWQLAPSQASLHAASSSPAILTMQSYYAHVTKIPFVEVAIIIGIAILALGAVHRVFNTPGPRSWVLLGGLLVAAPYFILVMGPSEKEIGAASDTAMMTHVLNILRGRVLIVALCVAAFLLLATEAAPGQGARSAKKRQ